MKKLKNIVKKNINIRNMYIKSKKEVHRETGRGKGEDIYHTSEIDKIIYTTFTMVQEKKDIFLSHKVEILFLCTCVFVIHVRYINTTYVVRVLF